MSSIKLIKKSEYLLMPWKNNLGSTLQIDIENNFLWRLSAATIEQACPFSEYAGYKRLLSLWQGNGLLLNDFLLKPGMVYRFNGEDLIMCDNLGSEVTDLGFIFRADKISAEMKCLTLTTDHTFKFDSDHHLHFIFCSEGQFKTSRLTTDSGDTLKIEQTSELAITLSTPVTKLIQIDIKIL